MVDSIKPTYASMPLKNPSEKSVPGVPDAASGENKEESPLFKRKLFVDRRRNHDRRSGKGSPRTVYDMRTSKGRRKSDYEHTPIETKA